MVQKMRNKMNREPNQDFATVTANRIETVSFNLLCELLPELDFKKVIFPLWVELKDRGYRQSNHSRLTPGIHDDGLVEILQRHLHRFHPTHITKLAKEMEAQGVFDQRNGSLLQPLPQAPVPSASTAALSLQI